MIYNNRDYPHPVLGIGDDIKGHFKVNMSVKLGTEKIKVAPFYDLENEGILDFVNKGNASFVMHIYCRSTMFREVKFSGKLDPTEIIISSDQLRNSVELDFFVCALEKISGYKNAGFNAEFAGYSFELEKGDILAYGGKGVFNANKTPVELKAISAFMNIDKYESKNGPIYNFYDGPKITIRLSESDYQQYQTIKENQFTANLLHSVIVLPALMEAINFVKTDDEFADNEWYKILDNLITESGENDILKIGQKILDNPVNRGFTSLENLLSGYGD